MKLGTELSASRVVDRFAAIAAVAAWLLLVLPSPQPARAATPPPQMKMKTEHFDVDPGWDGRNNRATTPEPRQITQDFGYSSTARAGGTLGEVGGFITPAGEAAYYAMAIPDQTFDAPFSVSGKLAVRVGAGNTLIGLFNSNTINEWRTPNTISLRIYNRDQYFYAYPEWGTSKWRAGAGSFPGTGDEFHFPTGLLTTVVHNFSLQYNPNGVNGGGQITTTIDNQTSGSYIPPEFKADGAVFNRFGFLNVMKTADGGGQMWMDNLVINGQLHTFDTDPNWDGRNNRSTYTTNDVRLRFNFGYSNSSNAGGAAPGEIGGQTFRGDSSIAGGKGMAYYGDRLEQTLDLSHPLKASGKISFNRGVSDSTSLIGFFHSSDSVRVAASDYSTPEHFVGAAIEGPSSEGFFFYPTFMTDIEDGHGDGQGAPYIRPDGLSHDWTLEYDPTANGGVGRISLTLDGQLATLDLQTSDRNVGAHFDRFGIITTQVDGLGQTVYFDDLTYTIGVPEPTGAAAAPALLAGLLARHRRSGSR